MPSYAVSVENKDTWRDNAFILHWIENYDNYCYTWFPGFVASYHVASILIQCVILLFLQIYDMKYNRPFYDCHNDSSLFDIF